MFINIHISIIIVIIIILIYIYYVQFHDINRPSIFIDKAIDEQLFRTGDLILFKANNNTNSIYNTSYFGHVGIVYINTDTNIPYLFEAALHPQELIPENDGRCIFITPLKERVEKYRGKCFIKPLNKELDQKRIIKLEDFIEYALENMYYNPNVAKRHIAHLMGKKYSVDTNCAELTILSLVEMDLLDSDIISKTIWHPVWYVTALKQLLDGYSYKSLIELKIYPFGVDHTA